MYDMTNDEILEAAARLTPQWLAGFFDGEGWVSAWKADRSYRVVVGIGQADPKIIALISLKFQGIMSKNNSMKTGFYTFRLNGKEAIPFLEHIKDHVVCKRRQVLAGLELAKYQRTGGGGRGETASLSPAEIQKRAELAAIIRNSNTEHRKVVVSAAGESSL